VTVQILTPASCSLHRQRCKRKTELWEGTIRWRGRLKSGVVITQLRFSNQKQWHFSLQTIMWFGYCHL